MSEKIEEHLKDLHQLIEKRDNQLHSLRMAVLEYYKYNYPNTKTNASMDKLALSAGIEFKNGTWKLKENSEDK